MLLHYFSPSSYEHFLAYHRTIPPLQYLCTTSTFCYVVHLLFLHYPISFPISPVINMYNFHWSLLLQSTLFFSLIKAHQIILCYGQIYVEICHLTFKLLLADKDSLLCLSFFYKIKIH